MTEVTWSSLSFLWLKNCQCIDIMMHYCCCLNDSWDIFGLWSTLSSYQQQLLSVVTVSIKKKNQKIVSWRFWLVTPAMRLPTSSFVKWVEKLISDLFRHFQSTVTVSHRAGTYPVLCAYSLFWRKIDFEYKFTRYLFKIDCLGHKIKNIFVKMWKIIFFDKI